MDLKSEIKTKKVAEKHFSNLQMLDRQPMIKKYETNVYREQKN